MLNYYIFQNYHVKELSTQSAHGTNKGLDYI